MSVDSNLATIVAQQILVELKRAPALSEVVWNVDDCASYMRCSHRSFRDRISKHYTFPAPLQLPSATGRRSHPRWLAREVIDWVVSHKA